MVLTRYSCWMKIELEERLILSLSYRVLDKRALIIKRVLDLTLGSLLAIISCPLLLVTALVIWLDSPGPIFFTHERLGLNGKKFRYIKFRTMGVGADQRLGELLKNDNYARQEYQVHHKLSNDPRITPIGKTLRKFSLDEIPQIFHVLRGEMSLVGPRPYMPSELHEMGGYSDLILKIRPGATGWWQVTGRHSTTFQQRLQLDLYYMEHWSIWLDLYIILKTVWVLLSGKGA